jgi:hypothetical protein
MKDESEFRQYLRRKGKKDHVVAELVEQVRHYEAYLAEENRGMVETAVPQDLRAYAAALEARQPGSSGKAVRGLALCYHFLGHTEMAALAGEIRERTTAKQRRIFSLKEFRGVNPEHLARLETTGIVNVEQMLAAGATSAARQQLAAETGVPPDAILELVKLSDLARLDGLKGVRAALLRRGGPIRSKRLPPGNRKRCGSCWPSSLPEPALRALHRYRKKFAVAWRRPVNYLTWCLTGEALG